jgi:hypothetical protein
MLRIASATGTEGKLFRFLVIGFLGQIAGRLVDLQWHLTHEGFEGAAEQFRAHWLIWLTTIFILVVATIAVRNVRQAGQRRGYLVVLVAHLVYAVVAVIHFFQHLDQFEVDWAHVLLTVSSIAAVVGVLWVIAARYGSRRGGKEAVA